MRDNHILNHDDTSRSIANRGLIIWAVSASAIALLLTGILIGKSLQQPGNTTAAVIDAPHSTEPGGAAEYDNYQVPNWLSGAPMEWRSEQDGSREGYAILFDYDRRTLLIDKCRHPGFFNNKANRPADAGGPTCERLLTANLLEFTDDGLLAVAKDGNTIEIKLAPIGEKESAKLAVHFDEHRMTLIPGQPNDLIGEIVAQVDMKAEYQQLFEFQQQQMRQQRAQVAAEQQDGVPRFSLPSAALEANEALRKADQATDAPNQ